MKRCFSLLGTLLAPAVALAHDSAVPHTHAIDHNNSDLFLLCVVTAAATTAGLLLYRLVRKGARPESRSKQI